MICKQFRETWKQGKQPSLEAYLEKVEQAARMTLFRNLIDIDIEFRFQSNQNPESSEYIERFPQYDRLIRIQP